jgi:hypothetical protein
MKLPSHPFHLRQFLTHSTWLKPDLWSRWVSDERLLLNTGDLPESHP